MGSTFWPPKMLQNLPYLWKKKTLDQGIYKVKLKVALNEKGKKTTWVFFFHKYGKFWSILGVKKLSANLWFLKCVLIQLCKNAMRGSCLVLSVLNIYKTSLMHILYIFTCCCWVFPIEQCGDWGFLYSIQFIGKKPMQLHLQGFLHSTQLLGNYKGWKMEFSQVIFWLFCFFTLCHSICTVKDETTQSNKPCSFPFRYNDKIYYGCTTDLGTGKNILACSTKTTLAYEHIEGQWISIQVL